MSSEVETSLTIREQSEEGDQIVRDSSTPVGMTETSRQHRRFENRLATVKLKAFSGIRSNRAYR